MDNQKRYYTLLCKVLNNNLNNILIKKRIIKYIETRKHPETIKYTNKKRIQGEYEWRHLLNYNWLLDDD